MTSHILMIYMYVNKAYLSL